MSERARGLQDSPWQGVFHLAGGGAGFLAELLDTPGASRTVLEARVPYAAASLAELLGGPPDQACAAATARALAMAAFQRAMQLGATRPFGFASTAALATDRPKRGRCRAHIAVQTATQTSHAQHNTFSAADDRAVQERELVEAAWGVLRAALGLVAPGPLALQSVVAAPEWRHLVEGRTDHISTAPHDGALLFPGAFNPPHEAHRQMMRHAEARLGRLGAFELSIANVDKPLLDYFEIRNRLEQLGEPVQPLAVVSAGAGNEDIVPKRIGQQGTEPTGSMRGRSAVGPELVGQQGTEPLSPMGGHSTVGPELVGVRGAELPGVIGSQGEADSAVAGDPLRRPVWLTRLPRFVDKARRFPSATFVVGIDTLIRIADPRYYGGKRECDGQIAEMLDRDVAFLVFGRSIKGRFQGLGDAILPRRLVDACTAVEEAEFRMDVSSTDIRTGA